jgi:DNA (cytosine-5)-methyltransferase 1
VVCVADHPTPKIDEKGKAFTLNSRDYKAPLCAAYLASRKDSVGTLMASMATKQCLGDQEAFSGDYHIIEEYSRPIQYVVRRLTPTECARLQGFIDCWGHPDHKTDFTDEEYEFWLTVRNTHAAINSKQVKDYTKAQMLTWYNKLHTDSSEYKLWGNGIALPNALYVMEGISEVLK